MQQKNANKKVKGKEPKETYLILYLANLPTDYRFVVTGKRINSLLVNVQKDVIEKCILRNKRLQKINYGFCQPNLKYGDRIFEPAKHENQ